MKRSQPPRRKKPLPRGKPPKRSKLVRRVVQRIKNKGKSRFPKRRCPELLSWIRGLPCAIGGDFIGTCAGRTEAAHLKSRGAGGDDRNNVLNLCTAHHREQHSIGWESFATKYWGSYDVAEQHAIYATVQFDRQVALGWVPGETG